MIFFFVKNCIFLLLPANYEPPLLHTYCEDPCTLTKFTQRDPGRPDTQFTHGVTQNRCFQHTTFIPPPPPPPSVLKYTTVKYVTLQVKLLVTLQVKNRYKWVTCGYMYHHLILPEIR